MSVLGQVIINTSISAFSVWLLFQQPFFVCKEFDSEFVDLRKWWELADNYEGAVTGLITAAQIIHSACAFNIGNRYREGFWKNTKFLAIYATALSCLYAVMLFDPNPLSCIFHINCGTSDALHKLGYNIWFEAPTAYFSAIGHNVIPINFRFTLVLISLVNLGLLLLWEGYFILGPVRQWANNFANGRWQVKKIPLRI